MKRFFIKSLSNLKKEEDSSLSLFRIPINFFSEEDDEKLKSFRDRFNSLKENRINTDDNNENDTDTVSVTTTTEITERIAIKPDIDSSKNIDSPDNTLDNLTILTQTPTQSNNSSMPDAIISTSQNIRPTKKSEESVVRIEANDTNLTEDSYDQSEIISHYEDVPVSTEHTEPTLNTNKPTNTTSTSQPTDNSPIIPSSEISEPTSSTIAEPKKVTTTPKSKSKVKTTSKNNSEEASTTSSVSNNDEDTLDDVVESSDTAEDTEINELDDIVEDDDVENDNIDDDDIEDDDIEDDVEDDDIEDDDIEDDVEDDDIEDDDIEDDVEDDDIEDDDIEDDDIEDDVEDDVVENTDSETTDPQTTEPETTDSETTNSQNADNPTTEQTPPPNATPSTDTPTTPSQGTPDAPPTQKTPTESPTSTDTLNNTRNMQKLPEGGNTLNNVANTGNTANNIANNATNVTNGLPNTVPGLSKLGTASKIGNSLQTAKDDKNLLMGDLAIKAGAKLAGAGAEIFQPGSGKLVEDRINTLNDAANETEGGKTAKRCCGGCAGCSCLVPFALIIFIILLPTMITSSIFGTNDMKKDNNDRNLMEVINEKGLANPDVSLVDVLNKALKDIKYDKYKDDVANGNSEKDSSGSIYSILMLENNYSINKLKKPIQNKHMALFQDVLDNVYGEKDSGKLKGIFDYDKDAIKFIDETSKLLDEEYKIYNPSTGLKEDDISLRDLFNETSSTKGDATYDINTISEIFRDTDNNKKIIKAFNELQESLTKLEILTYMQSYRKYYSQINTLRTEKSYRLPDVYYNDEFFEQFSTITDVATYISLTNTTFNPSLVYEIACLSIDAWSNPPKLTTATFNSNTIAYISTLETWYAGYHFGLVTIGDDATLECTGSTTKQSAEALFEKYDITDKDKFFALFKTATGVDPIEGEGNIYTPYNLDGNWSSNTGFSGGNTKAGSGMYSFTNATTVYTSTTNADGTISTTYTTTRYLTYNGCSLPLATKNLKVSMAFGQRYSKSTIEKFGLTHADHRGIDYSVPIGTPVLAIQDGTVLDIKYNSTGYGNTVRVKHDDGTVAIYAHGNGINNVSIGQKIKAGTQIMESGNSGNSTGPHLHLELIDSDGVTRLDPHEYIGVKERKTTSSVTQSPTPNLKLQGQQTLKD